MGWFSLLGGNFKPSDDYLKNHKLKGYQDGDVENDDYDVEDDVEALTCSRTCSKCGRTFTLEEAMGDYSYHFNSDLDYLSDYCGDICGDCAIEDMERKIE